MTDQKNTLLAIALSAIVLLAWQYFLGFPQVHEAQKQAQTQTQQAPPTQQTQTQQTQAGPTPGGSAGPVSVPGQSAAPAARTLTRDEAIKDSGTRVAIETPSLMGSIALKGARIDDVLLSKFRETVD